MKQFKIEYDFIGSEVVAGVAVEKVEHIVQVYPEEIFQKVMPLLAIHIFIKNIKVEEVQA